MESSAVSRLKAAFSSSQMFLQEAREPRQVFPQQYGGMIAWHFENVQTSSEESVPSERGIRGVQVSLMAVARSEQDRAAVERPKLVVFQRVHDRALESLCGHFVERLVARLDRALPAMDCPGVKEVLETCKRSPHFRFRPRY
jgi:hypothetical protein